MKNVLTISFITSMVLMAATPIHDAMDNRLKGKSFGGTTDDNVADKDGLGVVTLQHHSGLTDFNNELIVQKTVRSVLTSSTDSSKIADVMTSIKTGTLGTVEDKNLLENVGVTFGYSAGTEDSCAGIKSAYPSSTNGIYTLSFGDVYCDMANGGWTLIAKFSNADATNWMNNNTWWYSVTVEQGSPLDPSINVDSLSKAFYNVSASDFKVTRSDNSSHAALVTTSGSCLSNTNFRSKLLSFGTYTTSLPINSVRQTCSATFSNEYASTNGFGYATCTSDLASANTVSFLSRYSTGDGAVIMFGGGGSACSRADHGIGVTENNEGGFTTTAGADDFGNNGTGYTDTYSLNLWVK